jgi:hypothetical protein
MELHPTPASWRIAFGTAWGATAITVIAVVAARRGDIAGFWWAVAVCGAATLLPAIGTLSASVDIDGGGVTVRRYGRATHYAWHDIETIDVVERRAQVPDGTEYHWIVPSRRAHMVAVPRLTLRNGERRELPALSARARDGHAQDCVTNLTAAFRRQLRAA